MAIILSSLSILLSLYKTQAKARLSLRWVSQILPNFGRVQGFLAPKLNSIFSFDILIVKFVI